MLDTFLAGLITGNTYALIALGVSLIIGVSNVINFAHGSVFATGTMVGWYLCTVLNFPLGLALFGVIVITGIMGGLINELAVRPFSRSTPIATLLATLALAMIIDNASQMIFGSQTRRFASLLPTGNFSLAGLNFGSLDLLMLGVSITSMVVLALFLKFHRFGRAIRATAQDREAAMQSGIPVRLVQSVVFVIASILGGIAGLLIGMYYGNVSPTSGYIVGIQGFAAATLGGLGNLPGAVLGGLVLGIVEAFGVSVWGDSIRTLITFGVLLGTLWLRPGGLLGSSTSVTREPMTGTFLGKSRPIELTKWQLAALLTVAVLAVPLTGNNYLMQVGSQVLAFALIAMSLTLLAGNAGQISLGQAGAVAIGAYCSALLTRDFGWSFFSSAIASSGVAATLTVALVSPGWKLRGHYQSIATLATGAVVAAIILNWEWLTYGAHGIARIPVPSIFGYEITSSRDYYWLALITVIACAAIVTRLQRSHLGRTWMAIRDDETAARSLGVHSSDYKSLAFAIGGFIAGLGGVLLAHQYTYIDPSIFTSQMSQEVLTLAVLGSLGSPIGAVMGAVVLVGGLEFFRVTAEWRLIIYGLTLLLLVRYRPEGLWTRRQA